VAILLPFELALLFAAGNTPALVFVILLGVLLTPPFMAAFAAATISKANPHASDSYGLTPFIATRPLTSAALIAAKLKMTIWSTLAAWLLVLVAIPLALELSGTLPVVTERAVRVIDAVGTPRAAVFVLLLLSGFVASTWKQLVQSLYIGFTGREWVIKANAVVLLSFLVLIGPIADWVHENGDVQAALWDALPWILAVLMCVKMSAAAWVATRLYRSRLLSDRILSAGAASWLVVVLALYGVLVQIAPGPVVALNRAVDRRLDRQERPRTPLDVVHGRRPVAERADAARHLRRTRQADGNRPRTDAGGASTAPGKQLGRCRAAES